MTERALSPLLRGVASLGRDLLAAEPDYKERLAPSELPRVEWTRTPVKSLWAYWVPTITGRGKGNAHIRVDLALRAPSAQVSDELLEFLLWHELCHHLTPNQGHDAEFRRLEALWPDAARLDQALDELSLTYEVA